ncbi:MAG: hypothetical protein Q4G59_00045 [Planctomycetia bacterium]|nr:hypothetical protein [Planctomycetia bacterium]
MTQAIQQDKPWNATENKECFSTRLISFTSTSQYLGWTKQGFYDEKGYALCGIAANECVLPIGGRLDIENIPDGASETILLGEISELLRPWGDPNNVRDPRLGLNTSPSGFGSSCPDGGTIIGFCDTSVRRLNKNIDPAVLRALALPNDGEKRSIR